MAKEWDKVNMKRETRGSISAVRKESGHDRWNISARRSAHAGCTAFYTMVGGTPK